ncbi:MAG: YdcF family protein [Lachnospiraceae bacterium]|nr:YdcF family protein [Lachnospiraceae bacterium]
MKETIKNHPILFAILSFLILFVVFGVIAVLVSTSYSIYLDFGTNRDIANISLELAPEKEVLEYHEITKNQQAGDIVEVTDIQIGDDSTRIKIHAEEPGNASLRVSFTMKDADGNPVHQKNGMTVRVNSLKGIFIGEGFSNYAGFPVSYYGITIYTGLMLVFFLWLKKQREQDDYYSYKTITAWASILFFAAVFLVYLFCSVMVTVWLKNLNVKVMTMLTSNAMTVLTLVATPFVISFAIAMAHSNISLMKNEGKKLRNMYGIFASILLFIGTAVVLVLFVLNLQLGRDNYAIAIIYSICSACFTVFQYMLAASIITGITAAYRKVDYDKDYIIILGCAIKKDGTLYPLIRGRVDRAIQFWKDQKDATGKAAIFIPSGGKGSDEILSEAQAMTNYLLEQGIPGEYILPETNSKTTLENMKFSKEIIESRSSDAKAVYSTTNFHVFRSGIFATTVGLKAEGIGAKTKWYFWPNALLRELLGIYATRRKLEIAITVGVAILAGISGFIYCLLV